MIEAFEGAYAGSTHSHYLSTVCYCICDIRYYSSGHGYELTVHVVSADEFAFYRSECPGSDMQCKFPDIYALAFYLSHQRRSEMQSGRRRRHRAVDMAVNRLIVCLIRIFRATVKVRRNRDLTYGSNYIGECNSLIIP